MPYRSYDWGEGKCTNCKHGWLSHSRPFGRITACDVEGCPCIWRGSHPYAMPDPMTCGDPDGCDRPMMGRVISLLGPKAYRACDDHADMLMCFLGMSAWLDAYEKVPLGNGQPREREW
jgi:hypothetical protein